MAELPIPTSPRPVVQAGKQARLMIIGQAPGIKVHETGVPWNDASGDRLRAWLQLDKARFYDPEQVAIMPMGFCFPGYARNNKGRLSDRPPRKECAPLWHQKLLQQLPNIQLTLLIGQYAQQHYLTQHKEEEELKHSFADDRIFSVKSLTERVALWRSFPSHIMPLVHPSPRNQLWLKRNPWFEQKLVPVLRDKMKQLFK